MTNSTLLKKRNIFVDLNYKEVCRAEEEDIWNWCEENFGRFGFVIQSLPIDIARFYFERDEDRFKFILRWR